MSNQTKSESYSALLKGIENGDQQAFADAMQKVDRLWLRPTGEQRRFMADLWDSLIEGVNSYKYEVIHIWDFISNLEKISDKLDMEPFENAFKIMYRYDNKPDTSLDDLAMRDKIDKATAGTIMLLGSKLAQIVNREYHYYKFDTERLLKTAKKSLLFTLKHGGPETKIVVIAALAHCRGSDLKLTLDKMREESNDVIIKKAIRDTLDVMRAREEFDNTLNHGDVFIARYPDESVPERLVIDIAYESIKVLFSAENRRSLENTTGTSIATRQLISLFKTSPQWGPQLFSTEHSKDYEKRVELDILMKDIQNALLHVVKRGNNERLRREAAEVLSKSKDERVVSILDKIVKRGDEGSDIVRDSIIPKIREPATKASAAPPAKVKRKATRS